MEKYRFSMSKVPLFHPKSGTFLTYSSFCRLKFFKTPLYTGVFKAQGILRFEK